MKKQRLGDLNRPPPPRGGVKRVESVEIKNSENSDGKELTFLNIKDRTAI